MITSVLHAAAGVPPVDGNPAVPAGKAEAFQETLARHQAAPSQEVTGATAPTAPAGAASTDLDAQARARQGLGLDGTAPTGSETGGDMILKGLESMRGAFDASQGRVGELMSRANLDSGTLMQMQMEMTQFTMLVDISSKLTGKVTSTFDTLMKGQ